MPSADTSTPLAEDISFGLQQTLLCLATDPFTDPLISDAIQQRLGGAHPHNLTANFYAEVGGDACGFALFVVLRQLFRPVFTGLRGMVRTVSDPLYDRLLRTRLGIARDAMPSGDDARRLAMWKEWEADTIVKSTTISTLSTIANAAIMKSRSPYSWSVLLISKYVASWTTTAGMLGLRWVLPTTMRSLDHELVERYIDPTLRVTNRLLGIDGTPAVATQSAATPMSTWQQRVADASTNSQLQR